MYVNVWHFLVFLASFSATALLALSYLPQVIALYKTKETKGISLSFWYILDLSLLMLFILAIDSGSVSLIVAQALNLVLALIVTGQIIYYRRGDTK